MDRADEECAWHDRTAAPPERDQSHTERQRRLSQGFLIIAGLTTGIAAADLVARESAVVNLVPTFSVGTLTMIVAAAAAGLLFLKRPGAGLVLLVVFVYVNLSQVLVRQQQLPSMLQLMVLPLGLAAWTERHLMARSPIEVSRLTLCLVAYFFVLVISSAVASDPALSDERVTECFKSLLLYVLVAGLATSRSRLKSAVAGLLLAGTFLAGCGIYQVVTGDFHSQLWGFARIKNAHIYGTLFEPRIAGPLGDPNFFAQSLLILVPLALVGAREARSWRGRALGHAAALVLAAGTLLTYSRGGALALSLVLSLVLWSRKERARTALLTLLLVSAGLFVMPADISRRLATIKQILPGGEEALRPDASFEKRKLLTAAAWRMFLDFPLLGVGPGNYTVHYETYADEVGSTAREYEDSDQRHYPHSLYLEIAAETGLVGLGVLSLAVATCFLKLKQSQRAFLGSEDPWRAGLSESLQYALVGFLASSIFLHGAFLRYLYLLLGLSSALYSASLSCERDQEGNRP